MDISELDQWFSCERRILLEEKLRQDQPIGLTPTKIKYLVRLCIYLCVRHHQQINDGARPPLTEFYIPSTPVKCSHSNAAELFYSDQDIGGNRAAAMMIKSLSHLGFISHKFDGNFSEISINPLLGYLAEHSGRSQKPELEIVDFDYECDAVPVAALLAINYNWMNRNSRALPKRISKLLKRWGESYSKGMRVLRRKDNLEIVGFYLLYPVKFESDINFSCPPEEGIHIGSLADEDPFKMATPGDKSCESVFVRSWVIEQEFQDRYLIPFLCDAQMMLKEMKKDFPNMCDIWTLIIHPSYSDLATSVGFQKINRGSSGTIYWMYQALSRFLSRDLEGERVV